MISDTLGGREEGGHGGGESGEAGQAQLVWWLLNLRAVGIAVSFITDPDGWFPRWCVELYPDAAGGVTRDQRKGMGMLLPSEEGVCKRGVATVHSEE